MSKGLTTVAGGERPPHCLCRLSNCFHHSRSQSPWDPVPRWGKPLPAWQESLPWHSGTSHLGAGVKASPRGTGQSQEQTQGNKCRMWHRRPRPTCCSNMHEATSPSLASPHHAGLKMRSTAKLNPGSPGTSLFIPWEKLFKS